MKTAAVTVAASLAAANALTSTSTTIGYKNNRPSDLGVQRLNGVTKVLFRSQPLELDQPRPSPGANDLRKRQVIGDIVQRSQERVSGMPRDNNSSHRLVRRHKKAGLAIPEAPVREPLPLQLPPRNTQNADTGKAPPSITDRVNGALSWRPNFFRPKKELVPETDAGGAGPPRGPPKKVAAANEDPGRKPNSNGKGNIRLSETVNSMSRRQKGYLAGAFAALLIGLVLVLSIVLTRKNQHT